MILIFMLDLASVHASVWRWWDVRRLKPRRSARKRKDEFLKQFFSETLRCDFLVVAGVSFSSLRFWRFLEQHNVPTLTSEAFTFSRSIFARTNRATNLHDQDFSRSQFDTSLVNYCVRRLPVGVTV
jgi:hypothetical protein